MNDAPTPDVPTPSAPIPDAPAPASSGAVLPDQRKMGAADLLPKARFGGPIPWVIAILMALVVIAAAGGMALRNLAETARADIANAATVQVLESNPELLGKKVEIAVGTLENDELVRSLRVVPDEELAQLLEPWLGAGATSEDIPIPALIDVELVRAASPAEIARLQESLTQAVPDARVDAQSAWLTPVYGALSALQYLALGLIVLIALATAAAVWLAARSAFATHRETFEIVHLLGGTDAQIMRVFQRAAVRDAAFGGVVGLVLGLLAVWLLGQQFGALDSGLVSGGGFGLLDWGILLFIPVAGVLLAFVTGRMTIAFALKSMF
ncbi:MAG: FtsX-like permease family protein [Pseudomonadota bacterium]